MKTNWPPIFPGARWYGPTESAAVTSVVRQKTPFRYYGIRPPRHVAALESAAMRFHRVPYALAVNSGTGALFTAVRALGIGPGDEVIVPSFMWVSTIGAVVAANAIPIICEVDDSFTMDPVDLERKINSRTRLIIPVHMAGAACDMKRITAIARRHHIAILEDCAQANGATYYGKSVGTFGSLGMFSFQVNKNITAGEGGLLITRSRKLYDAICAAHDVGAPWRNGGPDTSIGVNCWGEGRRMGELAGAVATAQYRKLPAIVGRMRAAKRSIKKLLAGTEGLSFGRLHDQQGDSGSALIMLLPCSEAACKTAAAIQSSGLSAWRLADFGMHVYYNIPQLVNKTPLSRAGNPWNLPANRHSRALSYDKGACPASDDLFDRSVLLSIPSGLTDTQVSKATHIIRHAVRSAL